MSTPSSWPASSSNWLESRGHRVVNGLHAFELEMSKLRQDLVLRRHGIRTPRTVLAIGREHLLEAAATFGGPFITKHDQGGKGLGIRRFHGPGEIEAHLDGEGFDAGPGARMILQQYIRAPEPFITRVEIVGGRFVFAMRELHDRRLRALPLGRVQSAGCQPERSADRRDRPLQPFAPHGGRPAGPAVHSASATRRASRSPGSNSSRTRTATATRTTSTAPPTTNQALGTQIGVDGMRELARYVREVARPGRQPRRIAC